MLKVCALAAHNQLSNLACNLCRRAVDIQDDRILVCGRDFQNLQLALQQCWRHEMVRAGNQSFSDQLL